MYISLDTLYRWKRGKGQLPLTLVTLLLALETQSEILLRLPVNLGTLGVVVNEVATISTLVLVVVGLRDGLVGEELILCELEDQTESRLVEVLHANVGELLEGLLIPLSDHFRQRNLVLHGRQPKLGDTGGSLAFGLLLLLCIVVLLVLLFVFLASLNLGLGGLHTSVNNCGPALIQRGKLGEVLLLKFQDLLLELSLQLRVLLLDTLQASDAAADDRGQGLDVAR